MAITDHGEIRACVIGNIQELPLKLQFGYRVLSGPSLTTLVVHRSGFVGNWQNSLYEFLQARWRDLLASGLIDALQLRGIPLDSPLHETACTSVPFHRRGHFEVVQDYWVLNRPHSFDGFLRNHPSIKRDFRKSGHRLARIFCNGVEIRCYGEPHEMELMLEHSEEIARKTWQRKLGASSFLDKEQRARYELDFRQGCCRGYILYLDQIPVAFQHVVIYKGVFYMVGTGYDPSYRNLGVGTYLLMHVIKDSCENENVRTLDFNVGNPEAKRQYCDSSFKVSDIHLFAPGPRLWIPILLQLATQGSHQLAKTLSHRTGFYQSIRKRWRHN